MRLRLSPWRAEHSVQPASWLQVECALPHLYLRVLSVPVPVELAATVFQSVATNCSLTVQLCKLHALTLRAVAARRCCNGRTTTCTGREERRGELLIHASARQWLSAYLSASSLDCSCEQFATALRGSYELKPSYAEFEGNTRFEVSLLELPAGSSYRQRE
jgi:hypothetical protein